MSAYLPCTSIISFVIIYHSDPSGLCCDNYLENINHDVDRRVGDDEEV